MKKLSYNKLAVCLSFIITVCACAFIAPFESSALEPDAQPVYRGIDVSSWQGSIDFDAVRDSGIEVVYIRAGVGDTLKDPYFEQNYKDAKAAGLKVGFYHYVTATTEYMAHQEAEFFASIISGTFPDCRPAMDFEVFYGLNNSSVNAIATEYLKTLQELTGYKPMIYSDAYNASARWYSSLNIYPLWVADYSVSVPPDNGKWNGWTGFQYSDSGSIPGISGNVDLDQFTPTVYLTDNESVPVPETHHDPTYQVQRGNTLWGIAQRYRTTVAELVELNDIANPNLIYPGETLQLPGSIIKTPTPSNPHEGTFTYVIRYGDTLSGIAVRYHTTVAKLAGINHISNPNLIYAGEILRIPE